MRCLLCTRTGAFRTLTRGLMLLALLGVLGCEGPLATEVLVVVDSDLEAGTSLSRLEVEVHDNQEAGQAPQQLQLALAQQSAPKRYTLPLSFTIAARKQGDQRLFRVVISGFSANGTLVAEQQVITRFRPGSARRLDVFLYGGCADACRVNGQRSEQTCTEGGSCATIPVRELLPELGAGDLGGYEAGASSSEQDANAPDASGQSAQDGATFDGGSSAVETDGGARDAQSNTLDATRVTDAASATDAGRDAAEEAGKAEAGLDAALDAGADAAEDGGPKDASSVDANLWQENPIIPAPPASCPAFQSGNTTVMGVGVQIFAGARAASATAPLLIFWYGTGGSSSQYNGLPVSVRDEIMAAGGVAIAPMASTMGGSDVSGNGVWFANDFQVVDQLVACAVRDHNVDPRRIYTTGCSTGAVTAAMMSFQRASYVAAVSTNSGGLLDAGQDTLQPGTGHAPELFAMHGSAAADNVFYSFPEISRALTARVEAVGGFAVRCDHGAGHCGAPSALQESAWQFMKDHPFGLRTEPYASALPASFPSYCAIEP